MYTSSQLLEKVNNYIDGLRYDRKPTGLYDPIKYVLSLGGKRIRPVLMLMAYNIYKDDADSIIKQAIALETYHNYTLLHDDLMDKAEMRRGKATVHIKWDDNTAILSGDSMLVLAYQRMMEGLSVDKMKDVMDLFTETALEIGEGQQYDMEFESRNDVTEDEYIEMIRLKTSVLLACALKIGAILGDASDKDADILYKFGEKIGLAFQLQDDYLDVYGDPKVFGKKIGGDILCNKKTYMLINAFNLANAEQKQELQKWIDAVDYNAQDKIVAVTNLYNIIGIRQLCDKKINSYFESALNDLKQLNVSDDKKSNLKDFACSLMKRKS